MSDFFSPVFEIDPEFSRFSFQMTDEYYDSYKESLKFASIKNPIIVWNGLVVDGHMHYRACRELDISFNYEILPFSTRAEVIRWRCQQLLNSQSLPTNESIRYCIGKFYLAELDYNKYLRAQKMKTPAQEFAAAENNSSMPNKTAVLISRIIHVSRGTVLKSSHHARAIDAIYKKCPSIAQTILREDISMSLSTMQAIAEYPQTKLRGVELFFLSQNKQYVTLKDIERVMSLYRNTHKNHSKKEPAVCKDTPQIKQMPPFDPDAAVLSLIFTIPSWINSIERTLEQTNFTTTSATSKQKLKQEISDILDSIYKLRHKMEEPKNE